MAAPNISASAVEMANGESPTAKQVQAAVEEVKPKDVGTELANAMGFETKEEAVKAVEESEVKPAYGMRYAKEAVKLLASISKHDKQRRGVASHRIVHRRRLGTQPPVPTDRGLDPAPARGCPGCVQRAKAI